MDIPANDPRNQIPGPNSQKREFYRANLVEAERFLAAAYDFAIDLDYKGDVEQLQHIIATIRPMGRMA